MRELLITMFALCAGLAGAAPAAGADLFSATRAVIAIVADNIYVGEAEGHLSGAGTLVIHAQKDPSMICLGQFTSSATLGGLGQMQCSDGAKATFEFTRLSTFRGYGTGSFGNVTMSFVYGLSHAEAGPYLKLPLGKKLTQNGTELALADQ
jgi:hypothetical protein